MNGSNMGQTKQEYIEYLIEEEDSFETERRVDDAIQHMRNQEQWDMYNNCDNNWSGLR
tara:strand:+ start:353 stop:526 length:174 start_codon:yes stop_codon:yes gene_type:complete